MPLVGSEIVVLAYAGYQELDFWYPVLRGREEGATVHIVGSDPAGSESILGYPVIPQTAAESVNAAGVAAVILPGGPPGVVPAASPEQLDLVRRAHAAGAVVAAIGTGAGALARAVPPGSQSSRVLIADGTNGLVELFRALREALAGEAAPA
jgi:protease I